jgi:uncharacterized protein (TIGR03067 family)
MNRVTSALFYLVLGTSLICTQAAEATQQELQGSWVATDAKRDGKAAEEVVGHRLTFTGDRFLIRSKRGRRLYAGRARINATAKPAAIDFTHKEGDLKGRVWKSIYALDGDKLITCDNAPNLEKVRPATFEGCGFGYVLVTFERRR